ncbi:carboxypeptidase-like regulatory domain-containing protein, partial [Flavobacterium sp.]|uniref:carboxypeptidase-like regulatory domain-containing protein n=1 Tax=Flavobacterium sp. TaxID=239 RepID=UPI002B4B8BBA
MTQKINKYFLQLLLFLIVFQSVFSQEKKNAGVPLQEILTAISNQHGVEFNSIDEEISIFKLTPPSTAFSLTEKLNYIRQNTLLSIEVLDEKYITISNKKSLCGYVFDAETNTPIENAILKIPNENQYIVSNKNGYFKFNKHTVSDIQISCMGYSSKTITAKSLLQENCPKIYLNPFIETLTEVIAQHYLTSGISKNEDGSLEVKPKKFGILPGLIEPDVLQTM